MKTYSYVMPYMVKGKPNVAFIAEFKKDLEDPDNPIKDQIRLTCGHWTIPFNRYCPHCGATIIEADPDDEFAQTIIDKFLERDGGEIDWMNVCHAMFDDIKNYAPDDVILEWAMAYPELYQWAKYQETVEE